MTTAIYIRTSTLDQNPENQLADCSAFNKWGEFVVFKDQQSAWKDNIERPSFIKLVSTIKLRKVEHLIVWDLDRLFRRREKLIEFFKYCKVYGCQIHSYRQAWLEEIHAIPAPWNEIMHDMLLNVMGWIAEDESQKKSERVKAAVRKVDGQFTKSYKGRKWGRKSIHKSKLDIIFEAHKRGLSVRQISRKAGVSKSAVHKYLSQKQA
ncbi:MAG: gamma delta resolvase [Siphoviridae sp. ctjeG17]|nr:MAG: gamma delta resolvase [Siphoviridae sp. ctjeG17]